MRAFVQINLPQSAVRSCGERYSFNKEVIATSQVFYLIIQISFLILFVNFANGI